MRKQYGLEHLLAFQKEKLPKAQLLIGAAGDSKQTMSAMGRPDTLVITITSKIF